MASFGRIKNVSIIYSNLVDNQKQSKKYFLKIHRLTLKSVLSIAKT
jgi:hypothetical protein